MKPFRLTRMTLLIMLTIAALVMAVAPAFAGGYLNQSFEDDVNNDGVPDLWWMKGPVVWDCSHPAKAYDGDCMIVFPANDDARSLIAQRVPLSFSGKEESQQTQGYLTTHAAANNLEKNRVFMGVRFGFAGYGSVLVYKALPAGTYDWTEVGKHWNAFTSYPGCPSSYTRGFMSLPHYGSVAVDNFILWEFAFAECEV